MTSAKYFSIMEITSRSEFCPPRLLCGLANTNKHCALYIGVRKDGRVRGIALLRKKVLERE